MAIGNLLHSGFYSYCSYDDLKEWHILTSENEVINFTDSSGNKYALNSLLIEAENTSLYIRILPSDYILYIPANESKNYDYEKISSIQVMNQIGTKIRWSGQYF